MIRDVSSETADLERRLKLPKGFYSDLLNNDDWSFVIKLSALFEATCTHVLVARLQVPDLLDEITHIEYANLKYGKIKILKKLGVLSANQYEYLMALATLRNKIVHSIENTAFSFSKFLETRL